MCVVCQRLESEVLLTRLQVVGFVWTFDSAQNCTNNVTVDDVSE